jgi:FixJ family two-component response regulator
MPNEVSHPLMVSVVDDDESVREAIESLLQSFGLRVEAFSSAEDFLGSKHLDDVTCLIVDVVMPGMSGLDLQARLASADQRIPLIFISAHDDDEARNRVIGAGALAFLVKPFQEQALMDAVHKALAQWMLRERGGEARTGEVPMTNPTHKKEESR